MNNPKLSMSNLSVGMKVSLGTGLILVFLVVAATVSFFGLSGANKNFKDYRQTARETTQLGRIQANLLLARLAAKSYIASNTEEAANAVETRITRTSEIIDGAAALMSKEAEKSKILEAATEIDKYNTAFKEVTVLVGQRNELVDQLNTVGPGIEKDLTAIMQSAFEDNDASASYQAGMELRNLLLARLYSNRFLVDNTAASAERANAELVELAANSKKLLGELSNPTRRELAQKVSADAKIYSETFNNVVDVINNRNAIIKGQMDVIGPKIADEMEQLKLANAAVQDTLGPRATTEINDAEITSTVVAGIAVLVGAMIAFFLSRAIARPVVQMTSAMQDLAQGNLEVDIPAIGQGDEIGKMANAVLHFKEAAIAKIELEKNAKDAAMLTEAERQDMEAVKAQQAERMQFAVQSMANGLKRFADGDLTIQLNEAFERELDGLRLDFNNSVTTINQTMQKIAEGSQSIDDKSREIRDSADSLSRRTESQAASLEETSAALEEITATVGETSIRAQEARDVAQRAKADTGESSKVVSNAITAMERIESASSEISQIIGVIDEIAFQTNLLALNAGVEAARAGDAGSGFAVVAQEVRELAQRSAEAAKEIKELITKSNTEVTSGVELVKATGGSLEKISHHVSAMNEKMSSISQAAEEQLTGIKEVNIAVSDMDQVTQQNAAMVEESTAVTFELASEVDSLSKMIGQFKLTDANGMDNYSQVRSAA